jgi:mono/diheme cytochrome c family protein
VLVVIVSMATGRGARAAADAVHRGSHNQSAEQAKRGETTYLDECARCHSETLGGTESGPALVGEEFVRAWTGKTVGDLFARVRDTMPADSPRRLTAQLSVDVVAYLLRENGLNAGDDALPGEAAALSRIVIKAPHPVDASSRRWP